MSYNANYIGYPSNAMESIMSSNEVMCSKVIEQVKSTQELVIKNISEHESSEYRLKQSLEERLSHVASWKWVLKDLSRRLLEAEDILKYEQYALRVILDRLRKDISSYSEMATKPGALTPLRDSVETAILEENKFLREEKQKFQKLLDEHTKKVKYIRKIRKRIEDDVNKKNKAIIIEEKIVNLTMDDEFLFSDRPELKKKKKTKFTLTENWESRCNNLKTIGLEALITCVMARQKVRSSRKQLSVDAEVHSARVETGLRRRLHANRTKFEELKWQKEEAIRDIKSLSSELLTTEKSIVQNIDELQIIEKKTTERKLKPRREVTKDKVDLLFKKEVGRLRNSLHGFRQNMKHIKSLQQELHNTISKIDCAMIDVVQVIELDERRLRMRQDDPEGNINQPAAPTFFPSGDVIPTPKMNQLHPIAEENESTYDEEKEGEGYPLDF